MKQLEFCPEILATQKILWGAHVKFWPFTLKIFSQLLDKIKLFCKQRKIIKIKFRSIWSILKAFTASRNLDIYKNNVLFRKAPLEDTASNLWILFIWLLLLLFLLRFQSSRLVLWHAAAKDIRLQSYKYLNYSQNEFKVSFDL